jgi:chorismate synthase
VSGIWGRNIKYSIFGESHGKGIGIVIDGFPAGMKLDLEEIQFEMSRRAPGKSELTTSRKEADKVEILSGYFNGATTGTPLCAVIYNTNTISKDYDVIKNIIRPGHADYTGKARYDGFNDFRGSGHFSGRITASLVFAGAIAKQLLEREGIFIGSHIYSIYNIYDTPFDMNNVSLESLSELKQMDFPLFDKTVSSDMKNCILKAKEEEDSVGGIIEAAVINLPVGMGDPFFDSLESTLAHLLFSIPAVKGVEFGAGFKIAGMKGSDANDEFYIENNKIKTHSNNNGGLLGGITNGMPLIFRCAIKPPASIGKLQRTVDLSTGENTELSIQGRHDPSIVLRAVPVVEAAAAMAIADYIFQKGR